MKYLTNTFIGKNNIPFSLNMTGELLTVPKVKRIAERSRPFFNPCKERLSLSAGKKALSARPSADMEEPRKTMAVEMLNIGRDHLPATADFSSDVLGILSSVNQKKRLESLPDPPASFFLKELTDTLGIKLPRNADCSWHTNPPFPWRIVYHKTGNMLNFIIGYI